MLTRIYIDLFFYYVWPVDTNLLLHTYYMRQRLCGLFRVTILCPGLPGTVMVLSIILKSSVVPVERFGAVSVVPESNFNNHLCQHFFFVYYSSIILMIDKIINLIILLTDEIYFKIIFHVWWRQFMNTFSLFSCSPMTIFLSLNTNNWYICRLYVPIRFATLSSFLLHKRTS